MNSTCWPHVTPNLPVCGHVNVRSFPGWQALVISGLLDPKLYIMSNI